MATACPEPRAGRQPTGAGPLLRIALTCVLAALALRAFCGSAVQAQALESALAPGQVSQVHSKFDEECQLCHVRFDRNAQDRLCMDCHKDVGLDLRGKTSFHGRMKAQACKSCHTEHKGRDARIVILDKSKFDHGMSSFVLRGAHQTTDCAKCHLPAKGFRIAARDCAACHSKDDAHKGSLGAKCAACHNEKSWKGAPFDHNTTNFALTGRHDTVKCADCHRDGQYKDTPKTCIGCHRKDDRHKTLFGDKCESCHSTTEWKGYRFNHEEQTRYPLVGKHRAVRCASCHVGNLYRDKLTTACVDCHRKDDKHKGTLGNDCVRCHAERDWKEQAKFSHDRTVFPLLGKHASVQCKDCHLGTMFKDAPTNCVGCHHKDDKHKGTLGESCDKCHNERDWKKTSFDHAKTAYPLLGRHQQAVCGACHKSVNYKEVPKDCYSCHQRDDKHDGQEGRGCASCHDEKGWRPSLRFDHGLARFPLLGKHAQVECRMCHSNALFKNAKSDCQSCHDKDDKHRRSLGSACGQCHNARGWKLWDFNHDVKTKFVLDGSHRGVSCNACHTQPATDRVQMSSQCVACHSKNDAHDGSYGRQCQQCHVTSTFREIRSRQGRPVSSAGPPALLPSRADATRVSAGRNGPMS